MIMWGVTTSVIVGFYALAIEPTPLEPRGFMAYDRGPDYY